jgi:flagellar hook-basal body complex protein FliE
MKPLLNPSMAAGAYALTQKMTSDPASLLARPADGPESFADILEAAVGRVRAVGEKSDALAMGAANHRPTDLVEVVTAVTESEAALETFVAVRDRVVAAYEEIMRMPI